ncbi:MAG: ABC transporter permease, partial [Bacteroidota bacterium]
MAKKFLSLFLKEEFIEEVLGDLDEKFQQTLEKTSRRNARFGYWYQVINYLRPFAFKSFQSTFILETMTTDHFKISYRFLTRNKGFSIINIGGIALGMVVSLLISLWVHDELSFNMHFEKYDRIVQVYRKDISEKGEVSINTSMVGQAGIFMKEHFSSIFNRVTMTFFRERPQLLTVGRQSYDQKGYFFNPDAPDMLSLEMVSGTRNGIDAPDGILLSESLAHTFFGDQNPIGKLVNLNVQKDLLVTGVFKDLPKNGAFANASFIASMELIYNEQNPYSWHNQNMRIYAELKEGVSVETASEMIRNMMDSHGSTNENESRELFLVPMKDWHLHAAFEAGFPVLSKRMQFVIMYSIIGAIVLLLACINFMNLNTARFQDRGKEVGVRKILGSQRKQHGLGQKLRDEL